MAKSWSTPYSDILKSHSDAWRDAESSKERKVVIEKAAKAIETNARREEDAVPAKLDDVCSI
jgi:hypothetical protein